MLSRRPGHHHRLCKPCLIVDHTHRPAGARQDWQFMTFKDDFALVQDRKTAADAAYETGRIDSGPLGLRTGTRQAPCRGESLSRLYDRILANGCRPWRFEDFPTREADSTRETVPKDARFPVALESLEPSELEDAFVVAADDVVVYLDRHIDSVKSFDIITNVAPPFPRMFIEFTASGKYKERHGLYAWGVLVDAVDVQKLEREMEGARWGLSLQVIFERRKGDPCGPLADTKLYVRPDGSLDRFSPEGKAIGSNAWVECEPQWFVSEGENTFTTEIEQGLWELMIPALFTLSLLHSRNVTAEPMEPTSGMNRAFKRRHGRPLTRYHVLNIEPMRKYLDGEDEAESKGLKHAVHECRGHFKRYSEDAPLFGRYTGQWWWASHQRGSAEMGRVDKDYEVRLPGFGSRYKEADEEVDLVYASESRAKDPDSAGRGLRAHALTQNAIAIALEKLGLIPRSPRAIEPPFDIAWLVENVIWVGEVKSLTEHNEEHQMRAALSQLLRYRQALVRSGGIVRTVVIGEDQPKDASWNELLAGENIELTWPGDFPAFLNRMRS